MKYLFSNDLSAIDNMILDSYLTYKFQENFFRIYTWMKPTLSLGLTNTATDINMLKLYDNYDLVRRETGGGIVLHDQDICFTLVRNIQVSPSGNYNEIKNHLEQFCLNLKLNVTKTLSNTQRSKLCFEGSNQHEIAIDNKKVIGIAQKKIRNRYLIQGTIQTKRSILNSSVQQFGLEKYKLQYILVELDKYLDKIYSFNKINKEDLLNINYEKYKQKNIDRFSVE